MERLFAVIEIATGKMALGRTYYSKRDAKLAIKNRVYKRNQPLYAVATFTITPTIVSTVDADGKWTEVGVE